MTNLSRALVLSMVTAAAFASGPALFAQETMTDRDEIVHVLNRITFGPRPGDVEAVQKMGLHAYIEQQLHPETIDDSAVEKDLAGFDLLQDSSQELAGIFYNERKAVIEKQKANVNGQAANATLPVAASQTPAPTPAQRMATMMEQVTQHKAVLAFVQLEQAKLVRAVESQRQLQEVLVDFWSNHFNIDIKKGPDIVLKVADDRDVIRPNIWGHFRDLLGASAKSPAMLFYLDNARSSVSHEVSPFMQNMLADATAKATGQPMPEPATAPKQMGGINENYAREIMELHTLGVDGGYTQKDVTEVARCFTGWSIKAETGDFMFRPGMHDNGSKVVLGHQIPAGGGIKDGETVLDILAAAPATAHHIAYQLCQRFVADEPPASLVDRVSAVFTQTGGDLRKVTESILTSPEFLSPLNYNNKIKSPLEFAVSAVRTSNSTFVAHPSGDFAKVRPAIEGAAILGRGQAADRLSKLPRQSLNYHILELGEPLFACTPPTGYKEASQNWVSPGALIERLNFAMALTEQKLFDVTFDAKSVIGTADLDKPDAVLDQCVSVLLQNDITPSTRKVLEQSALPAPGENKTVNPNKLIALLIGSPEFQRK